MNKHLFITGDRLSGKSTLIKECLVPYLPVTGGFFTQRIFNCSEYFAFRMVPIDAGEPYLLNNEASSLENLPGVIVAKEEGASFWQDYPGVLDTLGVECINRALRGEQKILLLDELGHIEINAPAFQKSVISALDGNINALGVLKSDSNSFLDQIRSRNDVKVVELLPGNREVTRGQVQSFLKNKAAG